MTCVTEFCHRVILFIAHKNVSGYSSLRFDAFVGDEKFNKI